MTSRQSSTFSFLERPSPSQQISSHAYLVRPATHLWPTHSYRKVVAYCNRTSRMIIWPPPRIATLLRSLVSQTHCSRCFTLTYSIVWLRIYLHQLFVLYGGIAQKLITPGPSPASMIHFIHTVNASSLSIYFFPPTSTSGSDLHARNPFLVPHQDIVTPFLARVRIQDDSVLRSVGTISWNW